MSWISARLRPTTALATGIACGLALAAPIARANANAAAPSESPAPKPAPATTPLVDNVLLLLSPAAAERERAADWLAGHWDDRAIPMLIEILRFIGDPTTTQRAVQMLQARSGERYGSDAKQWRIWLWDREPFAAGALAEFKSLLYRKIDPHFEAYFSPERAATIRLDEVIWGGVGQDGIPPLRNPKMIAASQADYLADSDIVFALSLNGDVRAYPKRIMGWHEMFVDDVGGVPVAGVYCTLCGTMILYETRREGVDHELGTSGFLFRSNKLMFDRATQSLWNTLWGQPVIGPLAEQGFRLKHRPIVTTTWGEWRRRHPETLVLSEQTGYRRDYREGAAYRSYYATDRLMFPVPKLDGRMKNKAEVLALSFESTTPAGSQLAISADYLREHPLYQGELGSVRFLVVTDSSGANRVYESAGLAFASWDGDKSLTDESGTQWTLSETALQSSEGRQLRRLPAHRAFWFAWYSAHPGTALVH